MELTRPERKELCEALCDAFRSRKDLKRMLSLELDVQLDRICPNDDMEQTAFAVVDWFEQKGRLEELIEASYVANEGNPRLQAFYALAKPDPQVRATYTAYLRAQYDRADLRGLLATEHMRLHAASIRLNDTYVPLCASVQDRRPAVLLPMERIEQNEPQEEGAGEPQPPFGFMAHHLPPRRERVSVDDMIATAPVTIILGDPGSGKSTALKHYALSIVEDPDAPLPLMISLAAYAGELGKRINLSLDEFAAEFYAKREVPNLDRLIAHARRGGRLVYLLDGLDEVASEMRGQVSDVVVTLARNRGGNRVLATSRITGYIPLALDDYAEATLERLDAEAIATFAHNWYAVFARLRGDSPTGAENNAEGLIEVTRTNPGVAKLADNPLTLTMLALLFFAGNADLPRQRVRLYDQVARTLIVDWRRARNLAGMPVGSVHDEMTVLKRLGPLAYEMHDHYPGGLMPRAEVARVLARAERAEHPDEDPMPAVHRFLDVLKNEVGLLMEKGEGQWAFVHQTFEEYFAAREIARRPTKMAAEIARRAIDPRWEEVIRLAIAYHGNVTGATEEATELVQQAILQTDDKYEPYLHRCLLLAGRVVSDDSGIDRVIALQISQRIIDLWSSTPVDKLARRCGEILYNLLQIKSLRLPLLPRVVNPDIDSDRLSILFKDRAVRAALLERLTNPNIYIRGLAARALDSAVTELEVQTALLDRLTDPDWFVRGLAARALAGGVSNSPIQAGLLSSLADTEANVRLSAARALEGVVANPTVQDALFALLADTYWDVRQAATETLMGAVSDLKVKTALLARLNDASGGMRMLAAQALAGAVSNPEVQNALLNCLNDLDEDVRWAAVCSLASIVNNSVVQTALLNRISDIDGKVSRAAAKALGGVIDNLAVQERLLVCLVDDKQKMRAAAAAALAGAIDVPKVRMALLDRLSDAYVEVRRATVKALAGAGWDSAVQAALRPLTTDDDPYICETALEWLAEAPVVPDDMAVVTKLVESTNKYLAETAYTTLSRWAERELEAGRGGQAARE